MLEVRRALQVELDAGMLHSRRVPVLCLVADAHQACSLQALSALCDVAEAERVAGYAPSHALVHSRHVVCMTVSCCCCAAVLLCLGPCRCWPLVSLTRC